MSLSRTQAANAALLLASAARYWKWRRATRRVEETQRRVLLRILRRNALTAFGREHSFSEIESADDYHRRVPLRSYEEFANYIERAAAGEPDVLAASPLLMFERSSGSASASKLVPYNGDLKAEFQSGIDPWLYSLYTSHPRLLTGRHYWSITPPAYAKEYTAGGIPIGFEEESEYFGPLKRFIVRSLMAVPSAASRIEHADSFRYVTLRFLLQRRDLTFVSVWNPTFLTLLLDALPRHADQLLADLTHGTLTPPAEPEPALRAELESFVVRDARRASEVARIFRDRRGVSPFRFDERGRTLFNALWPRLALISCWADASASEYALRLRDYFPGVRVQPKGLLATEGFVSFPAKRSASAGAALSLHSHFFEFMESDGESSRRRARLAHELSEGETYSVVMTTAGGLYRYRLRDLVRVTGFINECPVIQFVGREDAVTDLCGEKLNESHVREVLNEQLNRRGLRPSFSLLAPDGQPGRSPHYTLFVEFGRESVGADGASLCALSQALDEGLRENPNYRLCRALRQLTQPRVFLIAGGASQAQELFLGACVAMGHRLGNIKPTFLHPYRHWAATFPGRYVAEATGRASDLAHTAATR